MKEPLKGKRSEIQFLLGCSYPLLYRAAGIFQKYWPLAKLLALLFY